MKRLFRAGCLSDWRLPGLILWLSLLSFGLYIPWLGLHGDDWPFVYLNHLQGFRGVVDFISWVRPAGAYIFAAVSALVGTQFWLFHALLLLLRAADACLLYCLVRMVFRECPRAALWAGLLLAVYPAFKQQQLAVEYYPHFIVLGLALLSYLALYASLSALRSRSAAWLYGISLLLSLNIFFIEYFFGLEMIRLAVLWLGLRRSDLQEHLVGRLRRAAVYYLPFLIVILVFLGWRVWAVRFPTYQPALLNDLAVQPVSALVELGRRVVSDGFTTAIGVWMSLLRLPVGGRARLAFAAISLAASLPAFFLALRAAREEPPTNPMEAGQPRYAALRAPLQIASLGLAALLTAGIPFWVTGLPVRLEFPWDRATLSFAPGACLLTAGVLGALQSLLEHRSTIPALKTASVFQPASWRIGQNSRPKTLASFLPAALAAALIGASAGQNFSNNSLYLKEWELQRSFYWQLAWRMPGLQPGAALVMDTSPFNVHVDHFLTPLLNWTYAPQLTTPRVPYRVLDFYKLQNRQVDFSNPDFPIRVAYGTLVYEGKASDLIFIAFEPPGCLRVLTPDDAEGLRLSDAFSDALVYSRPERIDVSPAAPAQPPAFLPQPERDWCYFFQSISLARQQEDWQRAAALSDQAIERGISAAQPAELLLLIEVFIRAEHWQAAQDLSLRLLSEARLQMAVCRAWQNALAITPDLPEARLILEELPGCKRP